MPLYHVSSCEQIVGCYTVTANQLMPVMYLYGFEEEDTCFLYKKEMVNKDWTLSNLGALEMWLYDSLFYKK